MPIVRSFRVQRITLAQCHRREKPNAVQCHGCEIESPKRRDAPPTAWIWIPNWPFSPHNPLWTGRSVIVGPNRR
jgi:hypothetical protein